MGSVDKPDDADSFATAMRAADSGDTEGAHHEADRLMVKQLRRLGYGEAMDAYDAIDKWYA